MDFTKITVVDAKFKENISSYLRRHDISYRYLQKLKKNFGNIKLNGQIVSGDFKIKNNDIIEIKNNMDTKSSIQTCIIPLDIVYEDDYMLVVNKPSNLATMPTKSVYDYNLAGAIMYYMRDKDHNFVCRIINRLDKEASGLVIVAKNSFTASFFNSNKDAIKKTYHALATGLIDKKTIIDKKISTITDELGRNQRQRIIDEENGLEATTIISPIKYLKTLNATLVEVEIINGRTHQIRLHTSSIDHALFGDTIYGKPSSEISHTALICKQLEIKHPVLDKIIKLNIPYPADIQRLIVSNQI